LQGAIPFFGVRTKEIMFMGFAWGHSP